MTEEDLEKLARNIEQEGGRYPPLIVRGDPAVQGNYQLLDGHQRAKALRRLGHEEALCHVWECDDAMALRLATLNRLQGEDSPASRAQLLSELTLIVPTEELAMLLPESLEQINDMLAAYAVELLSQFEEAAEQYGREADRLVSFALSPDDEAVVDQAISQALAAMDGANRRGRALGQIARCYLGMCTNG